MDLQHGESKRFKAYVKSLRIQNKALSRTLCLGRAVLPLLCCAPHAVGDAIFQVQDETHHHPFTSSCSLPLHTAADSVCCSHLSGCCRFACEAREEAATLRRLSPFTLSTTEKLCRELGVRKELEKRRKEGIDKIKQCL